MRFDMHSPCESCPFRNNIAFYLRPYRRVEIADALRHDLTFTCHKTIDYGAWEDTGEGERLANIDEQHCAGALIALAKNDELWANWRLRYAAMLKLFDHDRLRLDAPVMTLDEFIEEGE